MNFIESPKLPISVRQEMPIFSGDVFNFEFRVSIWKHFFDAGVNGRTNTEFVSAINSQPENQKVTKLCTMQVQSKFKIQILV